MGCLQAKEAPAPSKQGGTTKADPKERKSTQATGSRDVMGRYRMYMSPHELMGEGTSSICRRGVVIEGGTEVAIKVYKDVKGGSSRIKETTLAKFRRQIQVLQELQEPFKKPNDPKLWHEDLQNLKPSKVFMTLIDYSKDDKGKPGPDARDGVLYVVTELAQWSLKDFLAQKRDQGKPLPQESVKNIAKAIIVAMAGLHAKGFVHIDMKPENMMMFNGRLKVIDVDGCVKKDTKVSIQDSTISFSPCYCSPEWARFLITDAESNIIVASPALDVWSVGMTLCELVTLDAILKPQYANFLRNAHSHREAGFLFMEWLGGIKKAPLPKSLHKYNKGLLDLLQNWLLVCNPKERRTCAECLANPYIMEGDAGSEHGRETVERLPRDRPPDNSVQTPLYKGTLWKLNAGGNTKDASQWIKRDMWIAHNHSLCYYSVKENRRLVLVDGAKLNNAQIHELAGAAKDFAFEVKTRSDAEDPLKDQPLDVHAFAAETKEDLMVWKAKLTRAKNMDMRMTFKLGDSMVGDLQTFKMGVKNRRMKVDEKDQDQFEAVFKAKLWKVKADGDRMQAEDWFERDFSIAKNGSLTYYSPKDERDLVYYTATDMQRAKIQVLQDGQANKPFAFQICLPALDGVEFAPGEFAAESQDMRRTWIDELSKHASPG